MKIILALSMMISAAFASTVGLSTHPFSVDKQVITTEFDNYISEGAGKGITAKFYKKLNRRLNVDAGVGLNGGRIENRIFAGADYEFFPDYGRQPRFSTKGIIQSASIDNDRVNSISIAPTLSKGLAFWGREAFPFIALPVGLNLNNDESSYETSTAIATGITSKFNLNGSRDLVANFEANIGLRNSFNSIVLGVSLPLL